MSAPFRRVLVAASAVALLMSGCGGGQSLPAVPSANAGAGSATTAVLDVTCQRTATVAGADSVAVGPDGLHVRVDDRSGRAGTYLNYGSSSPDGGGGIGAGDPVAPGTSQLVLTVRPGPLDLYCSYNDGTDETAKVRVRVTDPHGYYRSTSLAQLGCPAGAGQPSWAIGPQSGSTSDAAVAALIATSREPGKLTAERAPIGYPASASSTYVVKRDGTPWATVMAAPNDGRTGYIASFDLLC